MEYIGFGFNKSDEEMRQLISSTFSAQEVVSQQISGLELAVALLTFSGFTLQFADFVLNHMLPLKNDGLRDGEDADENDDEDNVREQRIIIMCGIFVTSEDIVDMIGEKEWTVENVLQAIEKIRKGVQDDF